MSIDYLAKAAEKIDQWEKEARNRNQKYGVGRQPDLKPEQAEEIARAWIELAAIERGVTPSQDGRAPDKREAPPYPEDANPQEGRGPT